MTRQSKITWATLGFISGVFVVSTIISLLQGCGDSFSGDTDFARPFIGTWKVTPENAYGAYSCDDGSSGIFTSVNPDYTMILSEINKTTLAYSPTPRCFLNFTANDTNAVSQGETCTIKAVDPSFGNYTYTLQEKENSTFTLDGAKLYQAGTQHYSYNYTDIGYKLNCDMDYTLTYIKTP